MENGRNARFAVLFSANVRPQLLDIYISRSFNFIAHFCYCKYNVNKLCGVDTFTI